MRHRLGRLRPGALVGIALGLLLAGCTPLLGARPDPAVQAARRACAHLPQAERYACIEAQAVRGLNPEICRLAGIAIDDACLQAVYQAAVDPSICERLYLRGVRPTCRAYYADAAAAKAAGRPVGWSTAIVPQEFFETMDLPLVYPENHSAVVSARTER